MNILKPCPFCGGDVEMFYWRKMETESFMQWGKVGCTKCSMGRGHPWNDIRIEGGRHDTYSEKAAIEEWNTRAAPQGTIITEDKSTWFADGIPCAYRVKTDTKSGWSALGFGYFYHNDLRKYGSYIGDMVWPIDGMFEPPKEK